MLTGTATAFLNAMIFGEEVHWHGCDVVPASTTSNNTNGPIGAYLVPDGTSALETEFFDCTVGFFFLMHCYDETRVGLNMKDVGKTKQERTLLGAKDDNGDCVASLDTCEATVCVGSLATGDNLPQYIIFNGSIPAIAPEEYPRSTICTAGGAAATDPAGAVDAAAAAAAAAATLPCQLASNKKGSMDLAQFLRYWELVQRPIMITRHGITKDNARRPVEFCDGCGLWRAFDP